MGTQWLATKMSPDLNVSECHNLIRATGQAPRQILSRLRVKRAAVNISCNWPSNAICHSTTRSVGLTLSKNQLILPRFKQASRLSAFVQSTFVQSRRAHNRSGSPAVQLNVLAGIPPFPFYPVTLSLFLFVSLHFIP